MHESDILAKIPGQFVAAASTMLPEAETAAEATLETIIEVPGQRRVRFTFKRFRHKRGMSDHCFWTAIKGSGDGKSLRRRSLGLAGRRYFLHVRMLGTLSAVNDRPTLARPETCPTLSLVPVKESRRWRKNVEGDHGSCRRD